MDKEKRDKDVRFRLTSEEFERLKNEAHRQRRTISEVVRMALDPILNNEN